MSAPSVEVMTAYLNSVLDKIRECGWVVQGVMGSEGIPSYVYTVGLFKKGLPEVVVLGLPSGVAMHTLNDIAAQMIAGTLVLEDGKVVDEVFGGRVKAKFKRISKEQAHKALKIARILSNETLDAAFQLIWPDAEGRFPGQKGATPSYEAAQDMSRLV